MKVGILGSGDVGRALGKGFVSRQHEVKIASRTPNSDKLKTWVNEVGRNASTGTFSDSAAFGEIIVLATNGSAIEAAIDLAKPQHFNECFNTVPNSQMVDPRFKDVEMMICGNDLGAKQQVTKILKEFGWKGAIDIGGIDNAGWLEAFVPLWARVGMALNTWDHVFKVAR